MGLADGERPRAASQRQCRTRSSSPVVSPVMSSYEKAPAPGLTGGGFCRSQHVRGDAIEQRRLL